MPRDKQKLGRRGQPLIEAILAATLTELAERGFDGANVASIADRAGVHETSVYRRFKTRENLLVEALLRFGEVSVPVPDTGSLRGDLIEILRALSQTLNTSVGRALARTGVLASAEEYHDERTRYWETRATLFAPVIERAIARGEIPGTVDARFALELTIAPIYMRLLLTGQPLDEEGLPQQIADTVLMGLAATPPNPITGKRRPRP